MMQVLHKVALALWGHTLTAASCILSTIATHTRYCRVQEHYTASALTVLLCMPSLGKCSPDIALNQWVAQDFESFDLQGAGHTVLNT